MLRADTWTNFIFRNCRTSRLTQCCLADVCVRSQFAKKQRLPPRKYGRFHHVQKKQEGCQVQKTMCSLIPSRWGAFLQVLYINIYIYIKLRGRPPSGGDDRAYILVHLAPILFCWNMVETTVFPWRKSLFFANWDAHASGESLVVLSLWLSLVVPSRFFVEARLVFSERPPLGYDALLCFCRLA